MNKYKFFIPYSGTLTADVIASSPEEAISIMSNQVPKESQFGPIDVQMEAAIIISVESEKICS